MGWKVESMLDPASDWCRRSGQPPNGPRVIGRSPPCRSRRGRYGGVTGQADMAMYAAKAAGKGGCYVFHPELDVRAEETRSLRSELRRAVERNEFVVFYQPIVNLQTGCDRRRRGVGPMGPSRARTARFVRFPFVGGGIRRHHRDRSTGAPRGDVPSEDVAA